MNRRWFFATALLLGSANVSFAQEPTLSAEQLLDQAKVDLNNPLRRELLYGLAWMQLRYRTETNFSGYEKEETFSKPAFENLTTAFASGRKIDFDKLQSVDTSELVAAYRDEEKVYGDFLAQYSKELGVEPSPEWTNLNARAMAGLALLTKEYRPPDDEEPSKGSWMWPFCRRR